MKNIKPSLIRTCILAVVIILLVSLSATSPAQTTGDQKAAGEWKTVEDVFGFPGANLPGGVIRFNMPRKDLHVIVAGTEVKPGLALGAWAAFHHVGDNDAMVMGDLVLTEDEVAPVMKALQDGGVEITALHNHFNGESPKIMYLHMGGHGDPVKKAQASRVDRAPKLDGTLDDPAWQQTSPITNFLQREPFEGQAPTEKTEVRILYSKHEVYFGIRCFDSDPKKIVATELRRDVSQELDEYFEIVIDSAHDRRNAYVFQINPLGTQRDALITEEQRTDSSTGDGDPGWDGVWTSEARVTENAHGCPLQQTSSGWRSQSKGTFLMSSRGDIIKEFQQRKTCSESGFCSENRTKRDRRGGFAKSRFFRKMEQASSLDSLTITQDLAEHAPA